MTSRSPDSDSGPSNFVARRFTLTEEIDQIIDELAEDHHGGNRSALIRTAVYAERQRGDEDELRHGLKRIENSIDDLTDQIESIEDLQTSQSPQSQNRSGTGLQPSTSQSSEEEESESMARVAREIYHEIRSMDQNVFTIDEIVANVDAPLSSVADGLDHLSEQDAIECLDADDLMKYRIID